MDAETAVTESLIDADQHRQDVNNGVVPAALQLGVAVGERRSDELVGDELDDCSTGMCRVTPGTAMLDTLEGAPPS